MDVWFLKQTGKQISRHVYVDTLIMILRTHIRGEVRKRRLRLHVTEQLYNSNVNDGYANLNSDSPNSLPTWTFLKRAGYRWC